MNDLQTVANDHELYRISNPAGTSGGHVKAAKSQYAEEHAVDYYKLVGKSVKRTPAYHYIIVMEQY